MKTKNIGSNMTEVITSKYSILVSYETPVAYYDYFSGKYYRTSHKWSNTTTRHINKWLDGSSAKEVDQNVISNLLESGDCQ